jgi:hypothetical protein
MSKKSHQTEPFLDPEFHIAYYFELMYELTRFYSLVLRYFKTQIIDPHDFTRFNPVTREIDKVEQWLEDKNKIE